MLKTQGKLKTFCEVMFCMIISTLIAVAALNIGLKTEPGKILPAGLSMRSGEMGRNIIRGIELSLNDIELIRSGKAASGTWRLLTFIHVDPFFYLALLLPAAAKTILMAGYYLRFGFCSAAMYYFLSKHLRLSRLFSVMLAVMYAFSSQIVMTAQFASMMNMAIMMPVVMSAYDSYLTRRTWNGYVAAGVASFGLIVSGGFGAIAGMPVMFLISLLMCMSLYGSFKKMFSSWIKILSTLVFGFGLSAVFLIPGLIQMDVNINIADSFRNSSVTYTVFEMIRGMFLLRSGSIYQSTAPLFYIGILTVAGVLAFALNENIPLRLKAASALIVSVIHITCCSSFVNEVTSIFGTAPMLNSAKLICLEVIIFFIAGIGLKNINGLTKGGYTALCLIPLFFLIISGNSTSGTTLASPILISTFLGIIIEAAFVRAFAGGRMSAKAKVFFLTFILVFAGINTAFIMFNNTIQKKAADEYFMLASGGASSESLILDKDVDIPVLSTAGDYLIVPADLRTFEPGYSFVEDVNYVSLKISGKMLFDEIFLEPSDKREARKEGNNLYLLDGGPNTLVFSPFITAPGERLFLYCNAAGGAAVDLYSNSGSSARAYTGPFFTEIDCGPGEVNLKLTVDSEGEDACRISVYKMDGSALEAMRSLSGPADSRGFRLDAGNTIGVCTLILPENYGNSGIRINGSYCSTFGFCGKPAAVFMSSGSGDMEVTTENRASGISSGMFISIVAAFCLIAIPLLQRYNEKRK